MNTIPLFDKKETTPLPEGSKTPPDILFTCLETQQAASLAALIFLLLLLVFIPGGCIPEKPTEPGHKLSEYRGMVQFHSRDKSVTIGSSGEDAQTDELPVTHSHFSYDFWMDSCEVTTESYRMLCGVLPAEYDTLSSNDPQLPVTYVSWFDAVLYCNERSKAEELDSIYSYTDIKKNVEGEIFSLSNLKVEYGRHGYRLPTEAEWIFAARAQETNNFIWGNESSFDSADVHSWYVGNSGGTLHPVATRPPTSSGVYDLTGNAVEWVNDSKSALPGGTVTDFVGGGNTSITERLLKGGSFSHDLTYLRLTCRSDQYPVDAASKNRYTGLRCVIGVIDEPTFSNDNGESDSLSPVTIITPSLISFIGSENARLIFVNKSSGSLRTLCCIDYSARPVQLYQFEQPTNVFTPTISPDGQWVAWASRNEGSFGHGSVFVRKLSTSDTAIVTLPDSPAFIPRWYVDPITRDTFLLYVNSAQLNDLATWNTTQTRMMRFQSGAFTGGPEIVEPAGAYHGGRSADGDYLATGYRLLRMKHLPSQTEKILFYAPLNGKTPGDTSQVCNVSISPSLINSNQVLFLDFGSGRDSSTLTNTAYHSHEYLFLGDYSGTVTSWYHVPAPFYSWDFTEWSTHPDYAVGAAAASDGAHRSLFCINLADGSTIPLCEGSDLSHPHLWIAPGSDTITTALRSDSLGWYDYPHINMQQAQCLYKMQLFWKYAERLDIAFVGSSVAADGIDCHTFTDFTALNMAVGAGDMATALEIIRHYLLYHCPRLKFIGISLDMNYLFHKNAAHDLFRAFTQSKGYIYDKNNGYWIDGLPSAFMNLMAAVPLSEVEPPLTEQFDTLGLARFSCRDWGPSPPPVFNADTTLPTNTILRENMRNFMNVIDSCAMKDINVLIIAFPMSPEYQDSYFYSALGPPQATAKAIIHEIDSLASVKENLYFYDAHNFGNHDYPEEEFHNYMHLCPIGAGRLCARLDSIMHAVIDK